MQLSTGMSFTSVLFLESDITLENPVYRIIKDAPVSHLEMDTNFRILNSETARYNPGRVYQYQEITTYNGKLWRAKQFVPINRYPGDSTYFWDLLEVDSSYLGTLANLGHVHTGEYANYSHNHDGVYSPLTHEHVTGNLPHINHGTVGGGPFVFNLETSHHVVGINGGSVTLTPTSPNIFGIFESELWVTAVGPTTLVHPSAKLLYGPAKANDLTWDNPPTNLAVGHVLIINYKYLDGILFHSWRKST